MIHDLTPWGGQDRSTLEIAWNLNKKHPLEVHSYQLVGYDNWPNMKHIAYDKKVSKPALLKYIHYHLTSKQNLKNTKSDIIQSTGTASLQSDIVQVQFIHHAWQAERQKLKIDEIDHNPLAKKLYHSLLTQFNLTLEKYLYAPNKHYIAISHSIKKDLMEYFNIPSEKIDIVHHGVNPEHFYPYLDSLEARDSRSKIRQELNINPNKVVLLHVGAINNRKGVLNSMKVIKRLKDYGFNNIHYLAVGSGNTQPYLEWAKKNNITDHVSFISHSKDIRHYYWAADLFFFPSLYEPFGLVILEAMACGLPTIASRSAGASELIEENVSGVTIPNSTDIENMCQILDPLLKNPQYLKHMSEEARKTALEHSWEKVAERYSAVYQRVSNLKTLDDL